MRKKPLRDLIEKFVSRNAFCRHNRGRSYATGYCEFSFNLPAGAGQIFFLPNLWTAGIFYSILAGIISLLSIIQTMKKTLVLAAALVATVSGTALAQDHSDLVTVNRWYNKTDNNYVTVAENEFQEGQLLFWGWKDKTPVFTAYKTPGEGRLAVYSWFNPVTKDYVSIAEDEYTDDQMMKMGYTNKKLQFYALTRRGPNTVAIYRWKKGNDWVTIGEQGDTDTYLKKNYRQKTFQYFGISRATDATVYNQL